MKYIVLFLLLLPLALAAPSIQIMPNSVSHIFLKDQSQINSVFINNTGDDTLWNLTLTNPTSQFTFPLIANLSPGQVVQYNYTGFFTAITSGSYLANFMFLQKAIGVATPEIKQIQMGATGFNVESLSGRKFDVYRITNIHTVAHTIVDSNNTFSYTILPNATQDIVPSAIGQFGITDQYSLDSFSLTTTTNIIDIYSHDVTKDAILNINYNVQYGVGNYTVTALTKNFSMAYNERKNGVLQIDAGNVSIYNLQLSGDWILFEQNNLTILAGDTEFIPFSVRPHITNSSETNVTYTKLITLTSTNAGIQSLNVTVFIDYAATVNVDSNCDNGAAYFQQRMIFCNAHPNAIECIGPEPRVQRVEINRTVEVPCLLNGSVQDVKTLNDLLQAQKDRADRQENRQNEDTKTLKDYLGLLSGDMANQTTSVQSMDVGIQGINEHLYAQEQEKKGQSRFTTWLWIIGITLILVGVYLYARRRYRQRHPAAVLNK